MGIPHDHGLGDGIVLARGQINQTWPFPWPS